MVSKRTEELIKLDKAHVVHPVFVAGDHTGIIFERAQGVYLWDTEGKQYIDGSAQLMCVNLGHCRKDIIDAAMEYAHKSDYTTIFIGYSSLPIIENARKMAEITPPGIEHFYFASGGSEAVDSAARIARTYWQLKGQAGKYKVISLYNSYHGQAGTSSHATGLGWGALWLGTVPTPGHLHIPPYYCYRCPFELNYPDCNMKCARFLAEIIDSEGASSVAAFLAEPIQGAGGIIDPPPEWWPMVRKICSERNVLMIVDEVMSGFARTGKLFAIEHYPDNGRPMKPDLMVFAKGITGAHFPHSAVGFTDEIWGTFKGNFIPYGFTYAGHPICAAASNKAIDIYRDEKVPENAAKVGGHIRERLEKEFMPLPCVSNIGGKGMFLGLELVHDKKNKVPFSQTEQPEIIVKMQEAGLYIRILGSYCSRLAICPPCTMTIEESDKMLDIIYPIVASL